MGKMLFLSFLLSHATLRLDNDPHFESQDEIQLPKVGKDFSNGHFVARRENRGTYLLRKGEPGYYVWNNANPFYGEWEYIYHRISHDGSVSKATSLTLSGHQKGQFSFENWENIVSQGAKVKTQVMFLNGAFEVRGDTIVLTSNGRSFNCKKKWLDTEASQGSR